MKNIVVFVSGKGSNCKNIYQQLVIERNIASLKTIISDNSKAPVLEWARNEGIPTAVVRPGDFEEELEFGKALLQYLKDVDVVVLAGYLKKIPVNVIVKFKNRIVNIHPALLPSFGGKGYYGMRVHRAVFDYGVKVSGITIHLVDSEYDHGPILFQEAVNIEHCSSPEQIQEEVLKLEHHYYPKVIQDLLENKIEISGRRSIWKKEVM